MTAGPVLSTKLPSQRTGTGLAEPQLGWGVPAGGTAPAAHRGLRALIWGFKALGEATVLSWCCELVNEFQLHLPEGFLPAFPEVPMPPGKDDPCPDTPSPRCFRIPQPAARPGHQHCCGQDEDTRINPTDLSVS